MASFATPWHHQMGHRLMAAFALRVGGQAVGFLRLCFDTPVRPTAAKLEQCQTLAQQAALALQMSRTSAKARTAAVAVEHERAARERLGERARLARDIHDTPAQGFLGILLHLETLRRTLTADPERAMRGACRTPRPGRA